ncbi:enoyl-CoA hydratase/isomerase family protein [Sphingomonas sp. MMS24-JH45]
MSERVSVSIDGHVATVVYARGPANFISAASVGEIADAFEALDADDEVRALVFATEGKVFCGGADLTGDKPLADEEWRKRDAAALPQRGPASSPRASRS